VLALAGAAVLWRWLVGLRTPLPGVDACHDLWLAQRTAVGDVGELAAWWHDASWAALLAPAIACGAAPFTAAQVAAAVLGGLTTVVTALVAERLREGAGTAAAVLTMVAAGPVVAAGAGTDAALGGFCVALAAWAVVARSGAVMLVAAVLCPVPPDCLLAPTSWLREARLGGSALVAVACLVLLPPRPRGVAWLLGTVAVVGIVAIVLGAPSAWLPMWAPLLAALGGVGLARLPRRGREALLAAVVLVECHGAWHEIEPREAAAERAIGRLVARRLGPEEHVASDLPRVLWAAGVHPAAPESDAEWAAIAADPLVAVVVATTPRANAVLASAEPGTFARFDLPADLADLAAERDVVILLRRRRS
jgi:hypothetical protein